MSGVYFLAEMLLLGLEIPIFLVMLFHDYTISRFLDQKALKIKQKDYEDYFLKRYGAYIILLIMLTRLFVSRNKLIAKILLSLQAYIANSTENEDIDSYRSAQTFVFFSL